MTRKIGYELFKPNARKNSRCMYLWIFLIFAMVITAYHTYQYGVQNFGPINNLEMIPVPEKVVNVQNASQQSTEKSKVEETLPTAKQASKHIPESGEQSGAHPEAIVATVPPIEHSQSPSLQSREHNSDSDSSRLSSTERIEIDTTNKHSHSSEDSSTEPNTSTPPLGSPDQEAKSNLTELFETKEGSKSVSTSSILNDNDASTTIPIGDGDSIVLVNSAVSTSLGKNPAQDETKKDTPHINLSATMGLPNFNTEFIETESRLPNDSDSAFLLLHGIIPNQAVNQQRTESFSSSESDENIPQKAVNLPGKKIHSSSSNQQSSTSDLKVPLKRRLMMKRKLKKTAHDVDRVKGE